MRLIFQVYCFCLGKLAKTQIMVYFLLENSLDILLFEVRQSYLLLIRGSFDQKSEIHLDIAPLNWFEKHLDQRDHNIYIYMRDS